VITHEHLTTPKQEQEKRKEKDQINVEGKG
jgi:hypothetical protein